MKFVNFENYDYDSEIGLHSAVFSMSTARRITYGRNYTVSLPFIHGIGINNSVYSITGPSDEIITVRFSTDSLRNIQFEHN